MRELVHTLLLPLVGLCACGASENPGTGEAEAPAQSGVGPTSASPPNTVSGNTVPSDLPSNTPTTTPSVSGPGSSAPGAGNAPSASAPEPTASDAPSAIPPATTTAAPNSSSASDPFPVNPTDTPSTGGAPASPSAGGGPTQPSEDPDPSSAEPAPDSVFPEGVTRPRIMIVGDSISAGPGCYKKYLQQQLQDNGYSQYEFVGAYTDDCGGDVRHSAVSCSTAQQYTQATFTISNCNPVRDYPGMSTLMASHDPDLVMIQLGVNDVWGGTTEPETVLAHYSALVDQARAHNPNIVVVVAQIHKIITQSCPSDCNDSSPVNPAAAQLVEAVPAWASDLSTETSPVFVADLWTNSSPCDADDCVHPDDTGAQRMGQNWYEALAPLLPKE